MNFPLETLAKTGWWHYELRAAYLEGRPPADEVDASIADNIMSKFLLTKSKSKKDGVQFDKTVQQLLAEDGDGKKGRALKPGDLVIALRPKSCENVANVNTLSIGLSNSKDFESHGVRKRVEYEHIWKMWPLAAATVRCTDDVYYALLPEAVPGRERDVAEILTQEIAELQDVLCVKSWLWTACLAKERLAKTLGYDDDSIAAWHVIAVSKSKSDKVQVLWHRTFRPEHDRFDMKDELIAAAKCSAPRSPPPKLLLAAVGRGADSVVRAMAIMPIEYPRTKNNNYDPEHVYDLDKITMVSDRHGQQLEAILRTQGGKELERYLWIKSFVKRHLNKAVHDTNSRPSAASNGSTPHQREAEKLSYTLAACSDENKLLAVIADMARESGMAEGTEELAILETIREKGHKYTVGLMRFALHVMPMKTNNGEQENDE